MKTTARKNCCREFANSLKALEVRTIDSNNEMSKPFFNLLLEASKDCQLEQVIGM